MTKDTTAGGVEAAAIKFINDLVHMQSGQGWSRAMVREAAAAFLKEHGIAITGRTDTTDKLRAAFAASPAPAGVENLMRAVRRAEDGAGSLPAREAVNPSPPPQEIVMAEKLTDREFAELEALAKINAAIKGPSFIMRWHWRGEIGRLARLGLVRWGDPPAGFTKSKFAGVEITPAGRLALQGEQHDD